MSGGTNPVLTVTVIDTTPTATPQPTTPPNENDNHGTGGTNNNFNPPTGGAPMPFVDVHSSDWFYPFVRAVWEQQLFNGTSHDTFTPQGNMARSMFVQVLANIEGVDLTAYSTTIPTFSDTNTTAWYYGAVEWARRRKAPGRPITRQEMAVLLNNYIVSRNISLPQGATSLFTDQADISAWAVDGVSAIQVAEIISGYPDGSFNPSGTATRAEAATIFARFLEAADLPRRDNLTAVQDEE